MPKPAEVQRLTTATHAEQVQVKLERVIDLKDSLSASTSPNAPME